MKAAKPSEQRQAERDAYIETLIYAVALALNDRYGWKRAAAVVACCVAQILMGYADQSGAEICEAMKRELAERGINLVCKNREVKTK